MALTLIALVAFMDCSEFWPDSNQINNSNPPANVVVWMRDLGEEDLVVFLEDGQTPAERVEIGFQATGDERLLIGGEQRRGYQAPENIVAGCYRRVSDRNGSICVGEELDNEAPIDPVVTGKMSFPTFGSGSSNQFDQDDMMLRCDRASESNSNLSITIKPDEAGSLLAHIVIKDGDNTLRDVAIPMNGEMTTRFDVGDRKVVQVDVQFVDRAGNFGEITSIEVKAPVGGCEGCSASGFGIFILLGLVGLRRRLAA